ncbi:hypothetical protein M6D81_31600 [Paenibacillus sp. J5C_2022]|nr:hypothetical protein [Paenibacillus sp. J5C2022]
MQYLSVPLTTLLLVCTIVFFIVSIFKIENLKWRKPVSGRTQSITVAVGRIFCILIAVFISFASVDYWKDNYWLISGRYLVIEDYVQEIDHKSKDLREYVEFNGITISFLFDSNLEVGRKYRIEFLPNTQTGIKSIEIK